MKPIRNLALIGSAALILGGCEAAALTALGVGASAGVSHTLSGITYRTFAEPLPRVKTASLKALNRMQIKVAQTSKIDNGEAIKAKAADRDIDIELEALSPNTTRMRVTASQGLFKDSATATEIIMQTERFL
ncbi:DUF3568 family protein [Thiobacter aerophilum]|uniref:DUF3568 family protein n=1 Tax=Thiobacter aerophilum TaxID=3121275 RepID=A0ABV0EHU6_9BURK